MTACTARSALPARWSGPLLALLAAGLVTLTACSTGAATSADAAGAAAAPTATAALAAPRTALVGLTDEGVLDWGAPLAVQVADGTLQDVTGTGPDGEPLSGTVSGDGRWTADDPLVPGEAYTLRVEVVDTAGVVRTQLLTGAVRPPAAVVAAALSPGDDRVVGIGQPVVVRLDREVKDAADRDAVEGRLSVTSQPAQQGAWRWMSDTELHWRPAQFWQPGTSVSVVADLTGLPLSGGAVGVERRTSTWTVGDAVTATVDVSAKTMTVSRAGEVLRVMPASMGREGFETRGGTHLVLEKFEDKVMDSQTLDLPPGEASYRTAVRHAVRITNSGTFTHGAPWSVKDQGVRNVSHGCINLSPADAEWFFGVTKRGDVVEVVNAEVAPLSYDAGTQDWNMSFQDWQSGL